MGGFNKRSSGFDHEKEDNRSQRKSYVSTNAPSIYEIYKCLLSPLLIPIMDLNLNDSRIGFS